MSDKIYVSEDDRRYEATGEQLAQIKADIEEAHKRKLEDEANQAAKEAAKTSALNKLTALGLTEEEIKAVLGIA